VDQLIDRAYKTTKLVTISHESIKYFGINCFKNEIVKIEWNTKQKKIYSRGKKDG